jgi:hypothetical protein
MTVLYRLDAGEPPATAAGTFWTWERDQAEYVAGVEAGSPLAVEGRLYRVEITIGDDLLDESMEPVLARIADRPVGEAFPVLRDWLLKAAAGHEWAQFTDQQRSWRGLMVYHGDSPLRVEPVD